MDQSGSSITSDLQNVRVRFTPDQLERLKRISSANDRSVPTEIRRAVREYLERAEREANA